MYFDLHYIRTFLERAVKGLIYAGVSLMIFSFFFSFLEIPSSHNIILRILIGIQLASFSIFIGGAVLLLSGLIGLLSIRV